MDRKRPPLKTGHSQIRENTNTNKIAVVIGILGLIVAIVGVTSYFAVWYTYYPDLNFNAWRNVTYRKVAIGIMASGGLLILIMSMVLFLGRFMKKRTHVSHHRRTISSVSAVSSDIGHGPRGGQSMRDFTST